MFGLEPALWSAGSRPLPAVEALIPDDGAPTGTLGTAAGAAAPPLGSPPPAGDTLAPAGDFPVAAAWVTLPCSPDSSADPAVAPRSFLVACASSRVAAPAIGGVIEPY